MLNQLQIAMRRSSAWSEKSSLLLPHPFQKPLEKICEAHSTLHLAQLDEKNDSDANALSMRFANAFIGHITRIAKKDKYKKNINSMQ